MRKLLSLIIALSLLMAVGISAGYAASTNSNPNAVWAGGTGQLDEPPCVYVKVRYGYGPNDATAPTLASGSVVVWDTVSADGFTISGSLASATKTQMAGVLISPCLTDDAANFQQGERSICDMAVSGYVLALCDTSATTTAYRLVQSTTLSNYFDTTDSTAAMSHDTGICLTDTGTDGMMPVMLQTR